MLNYQNFKSLRIYYFAAILFLIGCTSSSNKEAIENTPKPDAPVDKGIEIKLQSEPDTLKGSLKAYLEGRIGESTVRINYYSPAVRGRLIWGGLVAFDNVWVTGAHKATNFEFDTPVIIGNQETPPGKYGFFTIPGKEKWTIILNKNWDQHLADEYDAKDDLVRYEVVPQSQETNQERLMYSVENNSIIIRWEKTKIEIPIGKKD